MKKIKYYITSQDGLAVFYSPSIGRKRYYRQSLSNPQKGMKLLTFKTKKSAQKVCDTTNKVSGGGWKVECDNYETLTGFSYPQAGILTTKQQ